MPGWGDVLTPDDLISLHPVWHGPCLRLTRRREPMLYLFGSIMFVFTQIIGVLDKSIGVWFVFEL